MLYCYNEILNTTENEWHTAAHINGVNLRNNVEWEKQLKEEYIEYDSVWKYEKKVYFLGIPTEVVEL